MRAGDINSGYFLGAVLLNFPQLFLKSYRWRMLLKQQGIIYNSIEIFLVYLSSLYFGFLTPGRAGEFIKVLYLKSDHNVSIPKGFSSVLVDRLFDLYLLLIFGSLGIWYFDFIGNLNYLPILILFILLLAPIVLVNMPIKNFIINTLFKIFISKKLKSKVRKGSKIFFDNFYTLINLKLLLGGVFTILSYAFFFLQCYFIAIAVKLPANFIFIVFSMGIANLISFIPISVSGLGTRDATLIFLFSTIGIDAESAILYSSLVFLTFFGFGGLIGFLSFNIKPLEFK